MTAQLNEGIINLLHCTLFPASSAPSAVQVFSTAFTAEDAGAAENCDSSNTGVTALNGSARRMAKLL